MKNLQFIIVLLSLLFCSSAWGGNEIYYIDRDSDGFGIGQGYVLGPDADDNDAGVNTPQSVLDKYGTLDKFLAYKGYTALRKIFISPGGNDAQAKVGSADMPYATWSAVKKIFQPGDVVLFREGTYPERISNKNFGGTKEAPTVLMAYPGETVTFTNCGAGSNGAAIDLKGAWHLVLDGFIFDNQMVPGDGNGICLNGSTSYDWKPVNNVVIRNVEAMNTKSGLRAMVNIHDLLVENCVIHDTGSHNIYWGTGSNEQPNSDLTLRNSILYMGSKDLSGRHCFQHNGVVSRLIVENNICHSTVKGGGISIENGASDSIIRNNLIFNTSKMGIQFYSYKAAWGAPMINNGVFNNTIWIGYHSFIGKQEPKDHSGILIKDSTGHLPIDYTKIRNNIICTQNGFPVHISTESLAQTTFVTNNILHRTANETEKFLIWSGKTAAKIADEKISINELNEFSEYMRNNRLYDPRFKTADIENYTVPKKFNFELLAESQAIKYSVKETESPKYDLSLKARPSDQFDAGCYEYTDDNFPPVFNQFGEQIFTAAGKQVSFSLSGVDPDGQALKYSCIYPPQGAAIKGASFTWTPDLSQIGTHKLLFEVTDGVSRDRLIAPVTVLKPDHKAPEILGVKPGGKRSVFVMLDEVVKREIVENVNNYEITGNIDLLGVEYRDNDNTLVLNTSPQGFGKLYTLQIKKIEDYSGNILSKADLKYLFDPLKAHWKLSEGSGSVAKDSSYNSYAGNIVGPEWIMRHGCHMLIFDGKNDYVQVKNREELNPVQEFSISMWINWHRSGGKKYQALAYKSHVFDLLFDGETIAFISNGKYKHFAKIQPGVWNHIVFTYREGGEMKLYVNAQCVDRKYKAVPLMKNHEGDMYIGARSNGRSHFYNGIINNVRFYHAELELPEVQNLYNEMASGL